MSRSYKKHPFCTDSTGKLSKKAANKRARRLLKNIDYEVANGRGYKALVESWDIRDYSWYESKSQAIASYRESVAMGYAQFKSEEEAIQVWAKYNKRK